MSCVKCEGRHVILMQNSVIMLGVGNLHSSCCVAADAYEVDCNDLRGGGGLEGKFSCKIRGGRGLLRGS